MDQRVADHYKGDLSKANIDPKAKERFFKLKEQQRYVAAS